MYITSQQARYAVAWALNDFAVMLSWISGRGRAFDGGSAKAAGGFTSRECVLAAVSYHVRVMSKQTFRGYPS